MGVDSLADAEHLRQVYDPDFLYIHSMNIDDMGHKFTSNSAQYRGAALKMDQLLAMLLQWHVSVIAVLLLIWGF